MTIRKIKCSNSTTLPTIQKTLEIDTDMKIDDLRKYLKDMFDITIPDFLLYLRSDKKWYLLGDWTKQIKDYPVSGKSLQIDIKRPVNLEKLQELREELKSHDEIPFPYGILHVDMKNSDQTRKILVNVARKFINDAVKDPANVAFSIPSRSGDNIGFDEETELVLLGKQKTARQFRSLSSVKSVQQLTQLMTILHEVLQRDIHSTKRDIFYMDVNSFESQSTSDSLIEDVGAMLRVTRSSMNVTASAKGVVIGNISFTERGDFIDCRKVGSGKSISPNIDEIDNLDSDAEFVLVIEKDAIFNRLAEDQFYDYIPSILITGKGQPDMATRSFVKKIHDELKIPILGLMDADVYGFEILRVYSVGSKALSFEAANLAVPDIKWLGLLPSDLEDGSPYNIPKSTHIKMTKSDERKIRLLLEEEFVKRKPSWKEQIEILLKMGAKAEIQALNARDPQFITNHYLPDKIESGNFI